MFNLRARLNGAAAHYDSILHHGALLNLYPCKKYRVLYFTVNAASIRNHAVLEHGILTDAVSRHTAVPAVNAPVVIKQVDTAVLRVKDLHICLPERRYGSYILPVTVKTVCIHLPVVL